MTIGEAVKTVRLAKGMTQKQLAELSGTTDISVSRWENGQRDMQVETLMRIADGLGVKASELVGMTQEDTHAKK